MSELVKVVQAAKELGVSRFFLYKLPKGTPGIYRLGNALRFDVAEIRAWAAAKSNDYTERGHGQP